MHLNEEESDREHEADDEQEVDIRSAPSDQRSLIERKVDEHETCNAGNASHPVEAGNLLAWWRSSDCELVGDDEERDERDK